MLRRRRPSPAGAAEFAVESSTTVVIDDDCGGGTRFRQFQGELGDVWQRWYNSHRGFSKRRLAGVKSQLMSLRKFVNNSPRWQLRTGNPRWRPTCDRWLRMRSRTPTPILVHLERA